MEKTPIKQLEAIFKGAANQRRLMILRLLSHTKEVSVGETAKKIHLSFTATSKHLNILYKLDLLERRQKDLVVYYRISANLTPLTKYLITTVSNSCLPAGTARE